MERPVRKPNRLREYDYSAPAADFVTFCRKDRKNLLWENVGASIARPQTAVLSPFGRITETAIRNIPKYYPVVSVEHYVIMPNHVHLLLRIESEIGGRPVVAPTISAVVQQMKGFITKQIGKQIWQKLFHDHVIRGERDYLKIWEYIDSNPVRWKEDCFYTE